MQSHQASSSCQHIYRGSCVVFQTNNPFRRAIQYAITLGGDTDTIASMAGAIAGAYYGDTGISTALQKHCEDAGDTMELADELLEAVEART